MKTSILIVLVAVAASAVTANAQTENRTSEKPQLSDIPNIGPLFRAPKAFLLLPEEKSLFGPDMPPIPHLDTAGRAGSTIRVLQTERGEVFQLEAIRQSRADILRKITTVMGVRCVIDPQLEKKMTITQTFRGLTWDDLLISVNYQVEMVKSPFGTYFFAENPNIIAFRTSDQIEQENKFFRLEEEKRRADPRYDPFVYPHGGLPVPELKGWGIEPTPQPDWQKREFNGHEFYYIPAPTK